MKKGRKNKITEETLETHYIEFLYWCVLAKSSDITAQKCANNWAKEKGFSQLNKNAFCTIYNVGKNYPNLKEKQTGFWDKFHNHTILNNKPNLIIALNTLLHKSPEIWYRIVYPEQAKKNLTNRNSHIINETDDPMFAKNYFFHTDDESPKV